MLAAIDPDGGYQRNGLEMTFPLPAVRRLEQLVDDEINDVLDDIHCVGI